MYCDVTLPCINLSAIAASRCNSFPSIVYLVKVVCVTRDQDIAVQVMTSKAKIRLELSILYNGKRHTRSSRSREFRSKDVIGFQVHCTLGTSRMLSSSFPRLALCHFS